jgi:SAM-dependent methyltransferase
MLTIPGGWRIRRAARALRAIAHRFPPLVRCNICAWSGRHFDNDAWHPRTICPGCGLQVRHRLLIAALQRPGPLSADALVRNKRVLHFAPEPALTAWFDALAAEYQTADLTGEHVDLRLDIAAMPEIADARVDAVIACDVLEHVPDDRTALRELRRVLSPDGCAILAVPQQDDLPQTYEDPAILSPAERQRAFGQQDHLRIYGDDFATRVAAEGFAVSTVSAEDFPRAFVERHVLRPPTPSRHPLATNRRRIYFARPRA